MIGDVSIMGIINVTPDSFSDGGDFFDADVAIACGHEMIAQGADMLDIGGESTRPGAAPLSPADEQARVLPVITGLNGHVLSIDTRNAATMRAARSLGASIINDVSALTYDSDALAFAASAPVRIVLMHMQGTPQTMQANPTYKNVVEDVYAYLSSRIDACVDAGIPKTRLIIDPGFGFGKTADHNWALLENLRRFTDLGVPVMAGLSRKRFLGPDLAPKDRLPASLQAAALAVKNGAAILRVHDVAATIKYLS